MKNIQLDELNCILDKTKLCLKLCLEESSEEYTQKKSQQAKGKVRHWKNKRSTIKFNGSCSRENRIGEMQYLKIKMAEIFPGFSRSKKPQILEAKQVTNMIN